MFGYVWILIRFFGTDRVWYNILAFETWTVRIFSMGSIGSVP